MAEDNKSSSFQSLGPNDLPTLSSSYRFNGRNYLQWAKLVRTILKGCNKLSHIESNAPAKIDPNFETWDAEDSLIMSWLWLSMTPEISWNYMFFSTAREIWENLAKIYYVKNDIIACYEIHSKIIRTKQGSLSVTQYYETLNGLSIELDQYQSLKMTSCNADSATLAEFIEQKRIFKFFSGLNSEYDHIRDQILNKGKLPSLLEVFYTVRHEETQRSIMLDDGTSTKHNRGQCKYL